MSEPNVLPPRTPAELQAALGKRLRWAIIGSILVNAVGWSIAMAVIKRREAIHQQVITMARIENKKRELLKPKKPPEKPKAVPKKQVVKTPVPQKQKAVKASEPASKAPKIVVANSVAGNGPSAPNDFNVASGSGKAGKPFDPSINGKSGNGNGGTPPVVPPPVVPVKPVEPEPKKEDPKPTTIARPAPTPVPLVAAKPLGVTRKAESLQPLSAIQVSIPGDLQTGDFKPFARFLLQIDEQGNVTPTLVESSGNAEIDRRIMDAVKKTRWQPAMEDGQPVASSVPYRFDFDVQ